MAQVIIEGEDVVYSSDYEKKLEEVKNSLHKDLFSKLNEENTRQINPMNGLVYKYTARRNEALPLISPLKVANKLNELLRIYRPLSLTEAKDLTPDDIMKGFNCFIRLVSYINEFIPYVPDKQLLSAFLGMTTTTYGELMQDPSYSEVFASFEDYFVSLNFTAGAAGLADGRTVLGRLQTQGSQGHNLVKSADNIQIVQTAIIDKKEIASRLEKFKNLIGNGNKK